jgi:hypothetical protein
MISKNFTKTLSLILATLIMTQALGQQVPEGTPHTKSPKRIISNVAQKRAVKTKDIIQGSIIGSLLLGSSFFVQDPHLKTALRVLAFAPMVVGFFMPQKFYQKFDKLDLELDEAGCSSTNYMCKGICADCRITKSYLAAIPATLIPYAIYSFFTKKPTEAPAAAPINPEVQAVVHNPAPIINPVVPNAAPDANHAAQDAGPHNANLNQVPAQHLDDQHPAPANINVVANEPIAEQARPAADAVQVEAQPLLPQENNVAPEGQAVAAEPQEDPAPTVQQEAVVEERPAADNAPQPKDNSELGALKSAIDNCVEGMLVRMGYEPENNVPAAQPAALANNAQEPEAAPLAAVPANQAAQENQEPERQGWGAWFDTGLARILLSGE